MTTGPPRDDTKTSYASSGAPRAVALPGRFEEPSARQYASLLSLTGVDIERMMTVNRQRLQRTGESDAWSSPQPTVTLRYSHTYPRSFGNVAQPSSSVPPPGLTSLDRSSTAYGAYPSPQAQRWSRDPWLSQRHSTDLYESGALSPWPASPSIGAHSTEPMSSAGEMSSRSGYSGWHGSWPGPLLRRTSSDEVRLSQYSSYFGGDAGSSTGSLHGKAYPQRRPSNRDEFDGPSQLLDKPVSEAAFEPKEEDLPQLPVTLFAQEQDDILSKVNDRLSQCAFDFVARYQFPIPIEPDKRPVRVPGDREWSEWVYLLKRLATKRRIPARVLYNGQIKQLITILENSLEMRHAAKHQSRPLKDDRNILQLISSGLQVAKILKDAQAMQYLDGLYLQTERLIQSRRVVVPVTTYAGS